MNKQRNNLSLYIGILGSVGSIVALLIVSLKRGDINWSESLNWNKLEPVLAIAFSFTIGIITFLLAKRLKKNERRVFIIYSNNDKEQVQNIREELEKYGVNVIMDSQILKVGDDILTTLIRNINRVNNVIVVLSKNTLESKWIEFEIETALNAKKRIFPVIIEDTVLPEKLEGIKYADLRIINKDSVLPLYESIRR